jgi:hypothetical protein
MLRTKVREMTKIRRIIRCVDKQRQNMEVNKRRGNITDLVSISETNIGKAGEWKGILWWKVGVKGSRTSM